MVAAASAAVACWAAAMSALACSSRRSASPALEQLTLAVGDQEAGLLGGVGDGLGGAGVGGRPLGRHAQRRRFGPVGDLALGGRDQAGRSSPGLGHHIVGLATGVGGEPLGLVAGRTEHGR